MAKRTLHAAFGSVIARNEFYQAETLIVDTTAAVRSHIFYTSGRFTWTNNDSGAYVLDCAAGLFIHSNDAPRGILKGEAVQDRNTFFCIDPKINKRAIPDVKPMLVNGEITFPAGSKLFLCEGVLKAKGKTIQGPAQIKFVFDTPAVNFGETAYGLLF